MAHHIVQRTKTAEENKNIIIQIIIHTILFNRSILSVEEPKTAAKVGILMRHKNVPSLLEQAHVGVHVLLVPCDRPFNPQPTQAFHQL